MRIVVLDANYPHDGNLYGDVFVHVRVSRYLALGHDVRVIAFFTDMASFTFDGVSVSCAPDLKTLEELIDSFRPDILAIHFFQGWMLQKLLAKRSVPVAIWVHGVEALGWYRRLFNFEISVQFGEYVVYNTIQMLRLRKLLRFATKSRPRVHFVFVSNWMRRVTERDTMRRVPSYSIIPNPIDTDRFPYLAKTPDQRNRVLVLRSFDSRKYANDVAVEAILLLSERKEFDRFQFAIHGRGRLFDSLTKPLQSLPNVTLQEGFLTQNEIRILHREYGVFLCPTRQDAQGVSMCEAMASGLVPLTSRSSAIPEFVKDDETGFLTENSADLVNAMLRLDASPSLFLKMSRAAAEDIRRKSDISHVVSSELEMLDRLVEKGNAL